MTKKGFTLIELLVVIVIITIIAGTTVMLMNTFFRGQGVRQGAMMLQQGIAQTKQLAADQRVVHYLLFEEQPDGSGGKLRIFREANVPPNKQYDAGTDTEIAERSIFMPKFVHFRKAPEWVGVEPNGYTILAPTGVKSTWATGGSIADISASRFEGELRGNKEAGDIILFLPYGGNASKTGYRMCMDLEKSSGKIRRSHFLAPQ